MTAVGRSPTFPEVRFPDVSGVERTRRPRPQRHVGARRGLDGGANAGYVGGLIKATIALRAAEAIAAA
jgi:hypothetical protein